MRTALTPKGAACALNLTPEYREGQLARMEGLSIACNPYDFWEEYTECYAWVIGWQNFAGNK